MEFVLVSLDIILQEDLDLLRHLRSNILQEEARYYRQAPKTHQGQGDGPKIRSAKFDARKHKSENSL